MSDSYVTRTPEGTLRLSGTRVTLASVVHCFWRGETPETIVQAFPALSLEQVYGATAYYLAHRDEVDRELQTQEAQIGKARSAAQARNQDLRARLLAAKAAT